MANKVVLKKPVHNKSPLMIYTFVILWLLALYFFGSKLLAILLASKNAGELALLTVYFLIIVFFWLLSCYFFTVTVFSFVSRPAARPINNYAAAGSRALPTTPPAPLPATLPATPPATLPPVAILYPTCNDFQEGSVATFLKQDYPNYHIYILDDSSKTEYQKRIDDYRALYPGRLTIIRRPERKGYKAGNLNYALKNVVKDYPFFAVMDYDEKIPANFLSISISYLLSDSSAAFTQANHRPKQNQDTIFANDLATTINPFWQVHCKPRNKFGYVLYLGHGAVVRLSAWEAAGGFPELVLEDLAFSAVLGEKGYRGIFIEDLICEEEFPASYLSFKRQHERYIIGTTQVIKNLLPGLLRSRKLSLFEKIDFCMWCTPLYVPAICLLYAIVSAGISFLFGHWHNPTISFMGREMLLPEVIVLDERLNPLWSLQFKLFSIFCSFSPVFAAFALLLKSRFNIVKLLIKSTVPYMSLMVISWRGILGYLLFDRKFSPPTGEQYITTYGAALKNNVWTSPRLVEISIGVILAAVSLVTLNLIFFTLFGCVLLGNFIEKYGWENKMIKALYNSCFFVIVFQFALSFLLLANSSLLTPLVFSVHF